MDWLLDSPGAEPPAAVVPTSIAPKPRGKLPPPLPREEPADSLVEPPLMGSQPATAKRRS
jgi:hypothetical protein